MTADLHPEQRDAVVIGAGFGGLAAALQLAEAGVRVTLCEALAYPGGCASTFRRRGARYESGATLFSGFGAGQLFADWIERYRMDVRFIPLDPLVELRSPEIDLAIPRDRETALARIVALAPDRERDLRRFFALQGRCADALWALFEAPALLPPFGPSALLTHAARLPRYAPLLRWLGQPLEAVLRRYRLDDCAPLRLFLDAVCQITVQASSRDAEASFAFATMDYYFRGTGHVEGGIGSLAWAMVEAVRSASGDVRMADKVKGLERTPDGWRVTTRRGVLQAPVVVANLLPQAVLNLHDFGDRPPARLSRLAKAVETGWGAAMLYLVVDEEAFEDPAPHHLELVQEPSEPFLEGNHLFVSVSGADEGRVEDGPGRTVTVSTHVPMAKLRAAANPGEYIAEVQQHMRRGLDQLAPELSSRVRRAMTGSPRTFERFTGRPHGYVGGVPRRAGLHNYRDLWPAPVAPGLYLVGDTVFPGQSTLAAAIGGVKLAEHLTSMFGTLASRRVTPRALPAPAA